MDGDIILTINQKEIEQIYKYLDSWIQSRYSATAKLDEHRTKLLRGELLNILKQHDLFYLFLIYC